MTSENTAPKAEFTDKVEERLDELRSEFHDLELEQMRKGEVEARAKLAEAAETIKKKRAHVEAKIEAARKAGDSAWQEARGGLESAWAELTDAFNRAKRDFDGTLEAEEEEEEETG